MKLAVDNSTTTPLDNKSNVEKAMSLGGDCSGSNSPQLLGRTGPIRKVRATVPYERVDLQIGESGIEAAVPITVGKMFLETLAKYPAHPALRYKEGREWKTITYSEYYNLSIKAAKAFLKLGLEHLHGVVIIGSNSPRWVISNLGAICAGGVVTGTYTNSGSEACYFTAHNAKANVIVVEDRIVLDKILEVSNRLPHLKALVQYTGQLDQKSTNIYDWESFLELGGDMEDGVIDEMIKTQSPEQCALLVHTSGTTGDPKAAMLSHDNLTWTARAFHSTYPEFEFGCEEFVGYYPLHLCSGQLLDIYLPIYCGATVNFAPPDAIKYPQGSLLRTLKEVQPTFLSGVPKVWEELMAVSAGKRNMREYLGLSRCKVCVSGGSPLHDNVVDFFMEVNISVLENYGATECTGPHSLNISTRWKRGSVGHPMLGAQSKIDHPDQHGEGEILWYGRHVFMGYLNSEKATIAAIDDERWFHSGDIGRIDKDGFLHITGRMKDLILTSDGDNVAPVPIEDHIKKEVPFLSNVMVIGENRKYLTCLVTLKCVVHPDTGESLEELLPQAKESIASLGSKCSTVTEIVHTKDVTVYKAIQEGLDRANYNEDADISHHCVVEKFTILEKDFSVLTGELGPTLKLQREFVSLKYENEIEAMYK